MQKRLSEFTKPLPFICAQIVYYQIERHEALTKSWHKVFNYLVNRYGQTANELNSKRS